MADAYRHKYSTLVTEYTSIHPELAAPGVPKGEHYGFVPYDRRAEKMERKEEKSEAKEAQREQKQAMKEATREEKMERKEAKHAWKY